MPKVIFFAYSPPSPTGHGGQHRAYQIQHDLAQVADVQLSIPVDQIKAYSRQKGLLSQLRRAISAIQIRAANFKDQPLNVLWKTYYTKQMMYGWLMSRVYETEIQRDGPPAACILEHTQFHNYIAVNKKYGIPTFILPQNLDALNARISLSHAAQRNATLGAFSNELQVLQSADERLFISKVEAGFIGGLGIPSLYYPYRPVGEIAAGLAKIRAARRMNQPTPGLFLILGTIYNPVSSEGIEWFLTNAEKNGLPKNIEVVMIGRRTDSYAARTKNLPTVKALGYVAQSTLDEYLQKAQGVLVLNKTGFGAITRLMEMHYAGIPTITFPHPTYAVDPIPDLTIADSWESWLEAMQTAGKHGDIGDTIKSADPSVLCTTLEKYLR